MSREKRQILTAAVLALMIVLILSVVLSMQLQLESTTVAEPRSLFGLLDIAASNGPVAITAEKREEEYKSRLPLTSDIVGNFESKVLRFLSSGSFTELDFAFGNKLPRSGRRGRAGLKLYELDSQYPFRYSDYTIILQIIRQK